MIITVIIRKLRYYGKNGNNCCGLCTDHMNNFDMIMNVKNHDGGDDNDVNNYYGDEEDDNDNESDNDDVDNKS